VWLCVADGKGGGVVKGAWLVNADLRGKDFSYQDLSFANLRFADLRDCNFYRANLIGADLRNADIRGANLSGALLPDSYFFQGAISHKTRSGKLKNYRVAVSVVKTEYVTVEAVDSEDAAEKVDEELGLDNFRIDGFDIEFDSIREVKS
jgi:uncharacterized protein YjbI with pentapeptide repeats